MTSDNDYHIAPYKSITQKHIKAFNYTISRNLFAEKNTEQLPLMKLSKQRWTKLSKTLKNIYPLIIV